MQKVQNLLQPSMIETKADAPIDLGRRQIVELLDFREGDIDLRLAQSPTFGNQLRQAMQGLRAEDDIHVRRAGDDRRAFLAGHAAADANHQIGLRLLQQPHPAEVVKNPLLRLLAHRAGVEENDVGVFGSVGLDDVFGGSEHVGHLVRIVLVHLAPEGADEQFFCHFCLISFCGCAEASARAEHPYAKNRAGGIGEINNVFRDPEWSSA